MRSTRNETSEATLARLIRAWDHRQPVTVTYTKADGTETVRTLEIHDVKVTLAGDIVLRAADRDSREMRSFRLDRIRAYTVHRSSSYTVEVEHAEDREVSAASLTGALELAATVTPISPDAAVALVADLLTNPDLYATAAVALAA